MVCNDAESEVWDEEKETMEGGGRAGTRETPVGRGLKGDRSRPDGEGCAGK